MPKPVHLRPEERGTASCVCNHRQHVWCVIHWLEIPGLHRARLATLMGKLGSPASRKYLLAAREAFAQLDAGSAMEAKNG